MANRILVLWPSGDLLCEGESALSVVRANDEKKEESPSTEPCPPTKRSPQHDGESGIFRRGERAA